MNSQKEDVPNKKSANSTYAGVLDERFYKDKNVRCSSSTGMVAGPSF